MSEIALATSLEEAHLPASEKLLLAALDDLGVAAHSVVWTLADVDWRRFSAVVIRTCWDYHLHPREFLIWIGALEAANIPVINHPDLIRWNTDKRYLIEYQQQGVTIPETLWLGEGAAADLKNICAEHGWKEAVVKPVISASAYGTERRRSGTVFGPLMVQEYLSAIETEGEWSLIYFDRRLSHAVRKRPRIADFRVQKDFGGSVEACQPSEELRSFAESCLKILPRAATLARVDIVEDQTRRYLMEMEVIEPELFLNYCPGSAERLAQSILSAIGK